MDWYGLVWIVMVYVYGTCSKLLRTCHHSYRASSVTKDAMLFPVAISAAGIVICILCGFVATNVAPVKVEADIERVLKVGCFFLKVFLCTNICYICLSLSDTVPQVLFEALKCWHPQFWTDTPINFL